MITHNNSSNFDSEFYKNQIEILSNGYFPEFDQPTRGKIENSFDYEKVLQTKFYKDRLDTKEFDNVENNFVNSSLLENQNSISNFQIVPQSNRSIEIFNVESIRKDFPILSEKVDGKNFLIWLDNAATTQKPKSVIDRLNYFYEHENSNVHRGAHALAARATDAYESARDKVARFLNAPSLNDIIFVRGATEAINLISQSFGKFNIQKDDEIIVSNLEHHANIVPWQLLASEVGAKIKVIPVDDSGQILLSEFERLITPRTKIVSVAHVSNALGTIVPIKEVTKIANRYGVKA